MPRNAAVAILTLLLASTTVAPRPVFDLPDPSRAGFTAPFAPRRGTRDRFVLRVITRGPGDYPEIVHRAEVPPGRIRAAFPRPEGPYAVLITSRSHAPIAFDFRTRQRFTEIRGSIRPVPFREIGLRVVEGGRPVPGASVTHVSVPESVRDLVPACLFRRRVEAGSDGLVIIPTFTGARLETEVEHERGRAALVREVPENLDALDDLVLLPSSPDLDVSLQRRDDLGNLIHAGNARLFVRVDGLLAHVRPRGRHRWCYNCAYAGFHRMSVRVDARRIDTGEDESWWKLYRFRYPGFTLESSLPAGTYEVRVRGPLGRPRVFRANLPAGTDVWRAIDIRGGSGIRLVAGHRRGRTISFRVLDTPGVPVEVEYTSPDLIGDPSYSRTGTRFDGVPNGGLIRLDHGRYRVEILDGDRVTGDYAITAWPDVVTRLDTAFAVGE